MSADYDLQLDGQLKRLDLLLHREILRLRASYQLSLDEFRGLYISDEQVDGLLRSSTSGQGAPDIDTLQRQAADLELQPKPVTRFTLLARRFQLSDFESEVLLLTLAPQLDLKYETLYAYLNNDVSRKWPTRDLALRLFSTNARQQLERRRFLTSKAALFQWGLLSLLSSNPDHTAWLSRGFKMNALVTHHLLGCEGGLSTPGARIRRPRTLWEELHLESSLITRLQRLPRLQEQQASGPLIFLQGRYGSGRGKAVEALSCQIAKPLVEIDLAMAEVSSQGLSQLASKVALQIRLGGGVLLLRNLQILLNNEKGSHGQAVSLIERLKPSKCLTFVTVEQAEWVGTLQGIRYLSILFPEPGFKERKKLWEKEFDGETGTPEFVDEIAGRFVLTPGQIQDAVQQARDRAGIEQEATSTLSEQHLFAAARAQSSSDLGKLAVKVDSIHSWEHLVLPAATFNRLQDLTAAIRAQETVYEEWSFKDRISSGRGLKVLFSGSSGTGKTMTAGVVSRDLGVDLYKIDLSGVVSKYIGETEKNLDRIFQAAHCSNSILFFDEADALFGKRSEVKDAHDRYANIEVAYLLQKMEEHEGVVILATNLNRNIDPSFSRRMHYVVEFPLPGEALRLRLWKGMFPPQTPVGQDVDWEFLSKNFSLAGGDIRNVVLEAAFLAASDGHQVKMQHLVKAMSHQMLKQGKTVSATDFKNYYPLLAER